jgi:hypothetical protein
VIAPRDTSAITFANAQAMVDSIWADMELRHPPKVERLARQSRSVLGRASRLALHLPRHLPSWCLLHELAHAMTATHDGWNDGHGPVFMGVYIQLLERYMRLPAACLAASAAEAGLEVDRQARPSFLDPPVVAPD